MYTIFLLKLIPIFDTRRIKLQELVKPYMVRAICLQINKRMLMFIKSNQNRVEPRQNIPSEISTSGHKMTQLHHHLTV